MPRRSPFLVALSCLVGSAACTATQSRVRLPSCVERIEVSGEHTRSGPRELTFDHTWDLIGTETVIAVEGDAPGERRVVVLPNSEPDLPRLFAGTLVAGLGTVFLVRRAYFALGIAEDPAAGETSWGLPVGLAGVALGAGLMATGWHPEGGPVLDGLCEEPATTD